MASSKYSWTMTEDKFRHIIAVPRIEELCQQLSREYYRKKTAGEDVSTLYASSWREVDELGWTRLVEKHSDGQLPFPESDVVEGYNRYMQHAQRTRKMFETKEVERAWTKVLAQLPNVQSFRLGAWDFDRRSEGNWREKECEIFAHNHNHDTPGHSNDVCQKLQEPVGEALFRAVIGTIIAARSKITQLDINCVLDNEFGWADDGTLDALDLSNLHTLSFNPVEVKWGGAITPPERRAIATLRCGLAVSTLLHKCSSSLHVLELYPEQDSEYLEWPPEAPIRLPTLAALKSFTTGLGLDLSAFAQFLHQSPDLNYLQLDGCEGKLEDWRYLWDAISDHPSRMTLEFDSLPCNSYTECSLSHYTGDASKEEFDEKPWANIMYSLENYLSGRRHWDRTLRMWFGDGNGEQTDSGEDGFDDSEDSDESVSESGGED